jgi:hypothetical protein
MRSRIWYFVAGAALLALIVIFGLQNLDRVTEQEAVPPGAEARRDRFLLAERTLDRLGLPVERITSLETGAPLPRRALLVVPARRGAVSRTGLDRLRDFVSAGGHLLVESEPAEAADPVFDAFGIERIEYPWPDDVDLFSDEMTRLADKKAGYAEDSAAVVRIEAFDGGEPLRVLMRGGESLHFEDPRWIAGDEEGVRVLQLALGDGLVTAVNDIGFATNFEFARADNAQFLWQLARTLEPVERVLIYRGHQENLWQWLRRNASAVLLALGAFLALWLWHAMPRFGPLLPDPEATRRRLLDHLAASGRFLWSRGLRHRLVAAAARHARESVLRRYPHLRAASGEQLAAFIARRFGVGAAQAARVVAPPDTRNAQDLVDIARACATVQADLARNAPHSRPKAPA